MSGLITGDETARQLGISLDDVAKLVNQEIIRPEKQEAGRYLFSATAIERIASNREPVLSEEAAQVGIQIQQEVVSSVSALERILRRVTLATCLAVVCFIVSVSLVTASFKLYPRQTSDFFGYYYRFNAGNESAIRGVGTDGLAIAGADVAPADSDTNISLAASLVKPIAATSLLIVKATDNRQYEQIVQVPAAAGVGSPGPAGAQGQPGANGLNGQAGLNGLNGVAGANGANGASGVNGADGNDGIDGVDGTNGVNGADGADGINGINGLDGVNGINGTNGINGIDGVNGIDGTSVADVTTTPGDIIIKDSGNVTTRLGVGADGQVLTIVGGIPAWQNTVGLTAEADTLATVAARGASTSAALNLSSTGNDIAAGILRLSGDVITDLSGSGLSVSGGSLSVSGLTNANLSGSAGITNANLANSSVAINTSGPLGGGGTVSLGGSALTLTCVTCLVNGSNLLTVASATGPNSSLVQGGTLTLAAGLNVTTTNNGSGVVTFATSATPSFTSINGLTITANGSNTLSIAAGKTLTANNSITFAGTDGTIFSLPAASDTLVGRSSVDTLLNKTIAAANNTISGLTNANLSGSAGITNANLANSGLSLAGNSGSGSVSLGGGLTFSGSGITSITVSGSALTVATNEADTLASVTGRGTTTSSNLTFSGGLTFSGSVTFSSLTSCRTLATNASGVLGCGDTTGDGAAFTDSTPATLADNDITELFNDASKPRITPTVSSQTILVSVYARFTGGGNADTDAAVRIVRNIGSAASCSTGTQIGDSVSSFLTSATDIQNDSGTFLDSPATTSQVFYTVCSSANSKLGSTPVSNRVDVTLVRIGR